MQLKQLLAATALLGVTAVGMAGCSNHTTQSSTSSTAATSSSQAQTSSAATSTTPKAHSSSTKSSQQSASSAKTTLAKSSSSHAQTANNSASLASVAPKQVAAAVIKLGDNSAQTSWQDLSDIVNDNDEVSGFIIGVTPNGTTNSYFKYSQPGTGTFYAIGLDEGEGWQDVYGDVCGYTISKDGQKLYLYRFYNHDVDQIGTLKPFKTLTAAQVVAAAKSSKVQALASQIKIEMNSNE